MWNSFYYFSYITAAFYYYFVYSTYFFLATFLSLASGFSGFSGKPLATQEASRVSLINFPSA
jgi:hypothetical protein